MLLGTSTLALVTACASIVGLDSSDPASNASHSNEAGTSSGDAGGGVTGDGDIQTPEGIIISPAVLSFTFNCGAPSTAAITIKNDGDEDQPYTAQISNSSNFAIQDAPDGGSVSGTVKAHDKVVVNITAAGVEPGSVSADVEVSAGSTATSVGISGEINGASLRVEPSPIDFGPVLAGAQSAPVTATFSNSGNLPLTITSVTQSGSDFVLPTAPISVPAGGTATGLFALNPGVVGEVSGSVSLVLDTVLCSGTTPIVSLKGKRTNDTVTLSPTALDLGMADCLSTPGTSNQRTVTLSNYNDSPLGYTTSLPEGSRFTIVSGGSGPAPAGDGNFSAGTSAIVVGLKPPGSYYGPADDILTVKPDGRDPVTVSLHALFTGADMKYDTNPVKFKGTGRHSIPLRNVGNATVCVNYKRSSGSTSIYTENDGDTFAGGALDDVGVYVDYYYYSTYQAKVSITHERCGGSTPSAPFCNPPPTLDVTASKY